MLSLNWNGANLKVAAVVSFYMSAALVMVFVNKAVLSNTPDLPLLFLFLQLIIAVVLLHVSAAFITKVEIPKLEIDVAKKLTPVVLVNAIGLVFNTLCLRGVEASFFQIARGLQLPLTILVSSLATRATPSVKVFLAAGVVTLGFFLGVAPSRDVPLTATPSLVSLFYGFLSSLFIAFHAVLIKSSLPYCHNSTIQLAWWSNAGSAVLLLPFIFVNGEHAALQTLLANPAWNSRVFVYGSLTTGLFGFLLCVAGLLSIKVTSPVTHMFSSAARSVLQTLLGVWIFSDYLTVNRATSILVILGGTMYYTYIKSVENSASAGSKAPLPRHTQDVERDKDDSETATLVWSAEEEEVSGKRGEEKA